MPQTSYQQKKQQFIAELKQARLVGGQVRLNKKTSNLFRDRQTPSSKLKATNFNKVILINTEKREAEVEGMTTFEDLVTATLPHGLMPRVVPELKSITLGGAVVGIGIESSSWQYGFVHESVLAAEIGLASGKTVIATPTNNYSDLFFALPNSYGTLGYILKLNIKLFPVKQFVELTHVKYTSAPEYFLAIQKLCHPNLNFNFIDGVIFAKNEMYITTGKFVDAAPYASDYTYRHIYYQSIQQKKTDYLTTHDYIWRWDTDWFWCSQGFGVQNPTIRLLAGKRMLNSKNYWKIRAFVRRHKFFNRLITRGKKLEQVIQDIEVPLEKALAFFEFFQKEIGISPVWVCPVRPLKKSNNYPLYQMQAGTLYINFGFWDSVKANKKPGYYNKLIEQKVEELGGKKSLYSESFYSAEKFAKLYNNDVFNTLKSKYDPSGMFKTLYEKTVKSK